MTGIFLDRGSTSFNRRPKDVIVMPIVVPKRKLRNVQRKILRADFVIRPHDTALQERPEAFDGVGMSPASDRLCGMGIRGPLPVPALRVADAKRVVALELISADQADATRDSLA